MAMACCGYGMSWLWHVVAMACCGYGMQWLWHAVTVECSGWHGNNGGNSHEWQRFHNGTEVGHGMACWCVVPMKRWQSGSMHVSIPRGRCWAVNIEHWVWNVCQCGTEGSSKLLTCELAAYLQGSSTHSISLWKDGQLDTPLGVGFW